MSDNFEWVIDLEGKRYVEGAGVCYCGRSYRLAQVTRTIAYLVYLGDPQQDLQLTSNDNHSLGIVRTYVAPEVLSGEQVDLNLRGECWE